MVIIESFITKVEFREKVERGRMELREINTKKKMKLERKKSSPSPLRERVFILTRGR